MYIIFWDMLGGLFSYLLQPYSSLIFRIILKVFCSLPGLFRSRVITPVWKSYWLKTGEGNFCVKTADWNRSTTARVPEIDGGSQAVWRNQAGVTEHVNDPRHLTEPPFHVEPTPNQSENLTISTQCCHRRQQLQRANAASREAKLTQTPSGRDTLLWRINESEKLVLYLWNSFKSHCGRVKGPAVKEEEKEEEEKEGRPARCR